MAVARWFVVTGWLAGCGGPPTGGGGGDAQVEARLQALEEQIATLEGQLSAAETELAEVQGQVDTLTTDVTTASDGVLSLTFDVATLTAAVDALSDQVALGQASVASVSLGDVDSIVGTDTTVHDLGSLTVTPPGPGQLVVVLTGHAVFFGQGRSIDVGIGDTATSLDGSIDVGILDGAGTERDEKSFTVVQTYAATGAEVTFHALAQGNTVFDAVSVNLVPQALTVLFVPDSM